MSMSRRAAQAKAFARLFILETSIERHAVLAFVIHTPTACLNGRGAPLKLKLSRVYSSWKLLLSATPFGHLSSTRLNGVLKSAGRAAQASYLRYAPSRIYSSWKLLLSATPFGHLSSTRLNGVLKSAGSDSRFPLNITDRIQRVNPNPVML